MEEDRGEAAGELDRNEYLGPQEGTCFAVDEVVLQFIDRVRGCGGGGTGVDEDQWLVMKIAALNIVNNVDGIPLVFIGPKPQHRQVVSLVGALAEEVEDQTT